MATPMDKALSQAQKWLKRIETETDPARRRLQMTRMALWLLDQAAWDTRQVEALAQNEDLTDFFMEYLDIGEHCLNFFDPALPHIDPEYQASAFERQIQEVSRKLRKITQQTAVMKHQYAQWSQQARQLETQAAQLRRREERLAELKALKKQLTPENLASIEKEISELQGQTAIDKEKADRLEQERKTARDELEQIQTTLRELQTRQTDQIEQLLPLCRQLAAALDEAWDAADRRLAHENTRLRRKNRDLLKICAKLEACLDELMAVSEKQRHHQDIYNAHFAANAAAADAINASLDTNDDTMNARKARIAALSQQISTQLTAFDKELGNMIQSREQTVNQIRKLNKTS